MNQHEDPTLDRALSALAVHDLAPMEARIVLASAEARLSAKPAVTRWMRAEPAMIAVLALAHLCWAIVRVYASP